MCFKYGHYLLNPMALIGSIRAAFNEGYKPAKINSMKETEKIKMI